MGALCPLCASTKNHAIYSAKGLPLFQNKVYPDIASALDAETGDVTLVQCDSCGFAFNATFEATRMDYNGDYQNEQAHSNHFRAHLESVADIVAATGARTILEVGCGKGTFLTLLKERGAKVRGFDPAYEGEDPDVVRDYFRRGSITEPVDLIVLRHTLEHVEAPLDFLHAIAAANGYRGKIYIEVPEFDWVARHEAFWDVFYEHCNYFTRETLSALFARSQWHELFGGQYQGIVADLADLVKSFEHMAHHRYESFVDVRERFMPTLSHPGEVFVWGASSKGVIFCNHLDRSRERIAGLVDINPAKQNRYAAITGHRIYAPEHLDSLRRDQFTIVVANPNYLFEIKRRTAHLRATYAGL